MGDIKRFIAVVGTLILIIPLLVACGGGDDDESDDSTATTVESSVEVTSTDPALPGGPTEAVETATGEEPTMTSEVDATETSESDQAATVTPIPSEPTPGNSDFAYGWNVATRGDETGADFNQLTIDAVIESGFGWIRFQVEWSAFEPQPDAWNPLPTDRIVEAYSDAGIDILIAVTDAPDWAMDPTGERFLTDYAEFEQLMTFMSSRYSGRVQAWEIWNEQNLADLVGGTVRTAEYFELLRAGYTGVKAGDPNALVAFGGLTPTGLNDPAIAIDEVQYLNEIYQVAGGQITNYFDILAVHVNSTNNPPDTMWPDDPGPGDWSDHESFYFRRTEQLYEILLRNGDSDKPIWITEVGWTTENPVVGYEYGADNTEAEVAEYVTRALEIARDEWSYVTGLFVWNLNWSTLASADDEKYHWAALNEDWTPRPLYEAIRQFEK